MKPHNKAVAIQYKSLSELPEVVASASGDLASLVVQVAVENEVPVIEDAALAEALSEKHSEIPQELLRPLAEVLCFLFLVDQEWREEHGFMDELPGLSEENTEISHP